MFKYDAIVDSYKVKYMAKTTVYIPDSIIIRINDIWNESVGSANIPIPRRMSVLWALEMFAQSGIKRTPGTVTVAPARGDERVVKVVVDVHDQLFNRVNEMWELFVESANIDLSKRKLVLWALERFTSTIP